MSELKLPRLLAAAKEFNIGQDTLIEFLVKKGFNRDDLKPTAKLSEDQYYALQAEFQSDKVAKNKADQVEIPKGAQAEAKKKKDEEEISFRSKEEKKAPPKEEPRPAEPPAAPLKEEPKPAEPGRVKPPMHAEPIKLRCVGIRPRLLSLLELGPSDCRYPYGGDKENQPIAFCGHPRLAGSSYCAPHFHLTRGPDVESERMAGPVVLRLVQAA